ncbi:hypothetical protein AMJ47_00430 [Parcubacteria bacterium DG_72]|nr:MAG: hypothetical protein AMJ47_00430 [Parcubacteria bacterium DG_72]
MREIDIKILIKEILIEQGIPSDVSKKLSTIIDECTLKWKPVNDVELKKARSIIVFSFDFVLAPNGNKTPGPINEKLAEQTQRLYAEIKKPVFAQWEVAELLKGKIPNSLLNAIYPDINLKAGGLVKHFSSQDVLKKALKKGLANPILVIAHYYHLRRCMNLLRYNDFKVTSDPDSMPKEFNPESGIAWTKGSLVNTVSHIISNLWSYRETKIYPRYSL